MLQGTRTDNGFPLPFSFLMTPVAPGTIKRFMREEDYQENLGEYPFKP
jgi:hypothetical protein